MDWTYQPRNNNYENDRGYEYDKCYFCKKI